MRDRKHDNSWLRSLGAGEGWDGEDWVSWGPPVLTIRCDSLGRPVAAVTEASVENVYLLHRHDGLGSPLDERHGPVFVECKCPEYGHRLDQRKVVNRIRYGDRNARVSEVAYDT
jgi:hypothetical protein